MCGSADEGGIEWPQFGQKWSAVTSFPIVVVEIVDVDVDGVVVGANDIVMVVDMCSFSVVAVVACPRLTVVKLLFTRCCSLLRLTALPLL